MIVVVSSQMKLVHLLVCLLSSLGLKHWPDTLGLCGAGVSITLLSLSDWCLHGSPTHPNSLQDPSGDMNMHAGCAHVHSYATTAYTSCH